MFALRRLKGNVPFHHDESALSEATSILEYVDDVQLGYLVIDIEEWLRKHAYDVKIDLTLYKLEEVATVGQLADVFVDCLSSTERRRLC